MNQCYDVALYTRPVRTVQREWRGLLPSLYPIAGHGTNLAGESIPQVATAKSNDLQGVDSNVDGREETV